MYGVRKFAQGLVTFATVSSTESAIVPSVHSFQKGPLKWRTGVLDEKKADFNLVMLRAIDSEQTGIRGKTY